VTHAWKTGLVLNSAAVLLFPLLSLARQSAPPQQPTPQAGGVAASEPKFRAVRSVSGSRGAVHGNRYVIEDPRTVFHIPADKQVIVYFDWDGPVGNHRFEALWKNPEGRISVINDYTFEAKDKRFGGYFTLLLSDTMATGIWTVEVRIDAELAGSHAIQILSGTGGGELPAAPVRTPLTTAQIYEKVRASTVFVEKFHSSGEKIGAASGFLLGDDYVVTAYEAIDGASRLKIILPDGRSTGTDHVVAFNRRQDWAILKGAPATIPALKRAPTASTVVGDRCYLPDIPAEGSLTLLEVSIIGKNAYPGAGERLNFSHPPDRRATGGPLLNEYGEVVGVVGGSLLPGSSLGAQAHMGYGWQIPGVLGVVRGALAVPIELVTLSGAQATTLSAMQTSGLLIPPVTADSFVMSASIGREMGKGGFMASITDRTDQFTRKDAKFVVLVNWEAREKKKGTTVLQFYDIDNQPQGRSKPLKVDLPRDKLRSTSWTVPTNLFKAGVYRADVMLDTEVAARIFFRIAD